MPDRVSVIVDDAQVLTIGELAEQLRHAGMQVDQVLNEIGMIVGTLPREYRERVRTMRGVAGIEDETTFYAPPPDEDVQ